MTNEMRILVAGRQTGKNMGAEEVGRAYHSPLSLTIIPALNSSKKHVERDNTRYPKWVIENT